MPEINYSINHLYQCPCNVIIESKLKTPEDFRKQFTMKSCSVDYFNKGENNLLFKCKLPWYFPKKYLNLEYEYFIDESDSNICFKDHSQKDFIFLNYNFNSTLESVEEDKCNLNIEMKAKYVKLIPKKFVKSKLKNFYKSIDNLISKNDRECMLSKY